MASLREKLLLKGGGVISLVGAGGKTTLMFRLARELADAGETVLTTTTTKIYKPSKEQSPCIIISADLEEVVKQAKKFKLECAHITAACGYLASQGKLTGFKPYVINQLWETGLFRWILVEADGAARKPLKAPASHEPVIPTCSGWVVAMIGLDAVGKPLEDQWVFRSRLYSQITGLPPGKPVTEDSVARIILHHQGLMKGSPSRARRFVFLNKAEDEGAHKAEQKIGSILLIKGHDKLEKIVIGALELEPPLVEW
ncbi:MAG: putative selenium-dependent hydroxylase accessory protein YqeC, partial [Deltaproteobacteria bacterium]|nr:putative selenium-dependent hydroxylase accessory protein YqeC [Deltaproteobacteria bacterium]